ncbi:response regulator [Polaromonas sp.]|jgi:signal transduction histidine kinase/DNA-binding response OmpR family regulator|uniref:response regulator n=1 Tax=Polaromonas sp. TaxID=1869339 RepID=UPI0037C5660E
MKRVLIVDDHAANLYLLRALLQGHGFEVDEALDGGQALERARLNPPDLVISDLLMPVMDGYTLLRHWKADDRLRAIPFVVYTATYTDPGDEALALEMGADTFLVKPTEPQTLMLHIGEVLERASQGGQAPRTQTGNERETLKLYNEVLVKKLEKRSEQLEQRVAALTESEARIQKLNRRYAVLSETNQAIVHIDQRGLLFETVCRIAVARGGFTLAWIGMIDISSGEVVPVAWSGAGPEWFARTGKFSLRGPRRTPAEIALGEGRIYLCNDVQADPALEAIRDSLHQAGLQAAAACPLYMGQHVVGVLTLFAAEKNYFDDSLRDLVAEVATDVSFALENYEKEDMRRQTEEELRRLNSDLEDTIQARTAELVAANTELEAFNYSVSHDLRAPLAAINGFSSIVLKKSEGQLDEASRGLLKRVLINAERMSRLIDDLLSLARASRQPMQTCECDLSELALSVVDNLRQADVGRKVDVSITPGLRVHADPGLMRILLENLIGNAWKFTAHAAQPCIVIGSERHEGETAYFVRDNGAGFDMAHAARLFTPFQRMHRLDEFEGSGIGLSIVQRIVGRHQGRIWAEATPGEGATLRFTLP